jgi:ribosomal protein L44E
MRRIALRLVFHEPSPSNRRDTTMRHPRPLVYRSAICRVSSTKTCAAAPTPGPAGVGKTRLARAVADAAVRAGWTVRRVAGTATGRAVTLGAFARWADTTVHWSARCLLSNSPAVARFSNTQITTIVESTPSRGISWRLRRFTAFRSQIRSQLRPRTVGPQTAYPSPLVLRIRCRRCRTQHRPRRETPTPPTRSSARTAPVRYVALPVGPVEAGLAADFGGAGAAMAAMAALAVAGGPTVAAEAAAAVGAAAAAITAVADRAVGQAHPARTAVAARKAGGSVDPR